MMQLLDEVEWQQDPDRLRAIAKFALNRIVTLETSFKIIKIESEVGLAQCNAYDMGLKPLQAYWPGDW